MKDYTLDKEKSQGDKIVYFKKGEDNTIQYIEFNAIYESMNIKRIISENNNPYGINYRTKDSKGDYQYTYTTISS